MVNVEKIYGAAYIRYSSTMQDDGFSLQAQRRQILERAEKDGVEIIEVYSDAAISAYRNKFRPGIQRMLSDARCHRFQVLYVHKLDRLARKLKFAIEVVDELTKYDITFTAVEQNFDRRTPEGNFMFNMLGSLGELYSDNLSKETHKGKYERSLSGYHNGILPWGYESIVIDGKKTAKLLPEKGEYLKKIFSLYATGAYTDGELADWLNSNNLRTKRNRFFSKDTVRDMLQNVFYTGKVHYRGAREKFKKSYRNLDGELSTGLHEAAIEEELFYRCMNLRKGRKLTKVTKQVTKKTYLLAGIIVCDFCERRLRSQSASNGSRYYRDTSKSRGFGDCIVDTDTKKSINADEIEKELEKIISRLTLPDSWKVELKKIYDSESKNASDNTAKIGRINCEVKRLLTNYERGFYDDREEEYFKKMRLYKEELAKLQIHSKLEVDSAAEIILSINETWGIATIEEKEKIVKMVFREVGASIKTGKITWFSPQYGFETLFKLIPNIVVEKENRYKISDVNIEMH